MIDLFRGYALLLRAMTCPTPNSLWIATVMSGAQEGKSTYVLAPAS